MDGGKCIVQLRGVRPFLSDKYDITRHKNYRYLSDSNPKNAFNISKLVSSTLKVKPDEEYEYFEYEPSEDELSDEDYEIEDFPDDFEPV